MDTVFELASKYYPSYWDKERIASLVKAGKLTASDYRNLTGEELPTEG